MYLDFSKVEKMEMLGSSKVQKDGRLVIPKKAREMLGIDTGDMLALQIENKQLVISKA